MNTVTVAGHIALDHIFDIPSHPEPEHSIYIEHHERHYGGGAANIASGIARLGGHSRLLAAVPEDFAATDYAAYLEELDVDLAVTRFPGGMPTAYIFNDEQYRQITYFSWGVSEHLQDIEATGDLVHLAPVHPVFACRMADRARYLAFEPGQDLPRYTARQLSHVLEQADMLFCNVTELHTMADMLDVSQRQLLTDLDAVVTRGEQGCLVYEEGETHEIPAVPADMVDPTGAGDAHRAAVWAALQRDIELPVACQLGNVAAALTVQQHGAQRGMPGWETLLEQHAQHFGRAENI
ncbi:MAG: carbohydrate kinase family protein [Thermoplasmatota archaeon]